MQVVFYPDTPFDKFTAECMVEVINEMWVADHWEGEKPTFVIEQLP